MYPTRKQHEDEEMNQHSYSTRTEMSSWSSSLGTENPIHDTTSQAGERRDKEFLQQHIPFLSEEKLSALEVVEEVAEGAFGSVYTVRYQEQLAVKKLLLEDKLDMFLREARLLVELDGAGGMPKLLALSLQPPALIQEYAGKCYDEFLDDGCSVGVFLDSVVRIAQQLDELHKKGVIHNDVKANNVTVFESSDGITFRIIDCGLTTRAGQSLDAKAFDLDFEEMDFGMCTWMSPELKQGRPVLPSSDVYALGVLLRITSRLTPHSSLKAALSSLVRSCTQWEAAARPTLLEVERVINDIKKGQSKAVLDADLYDDHSTTR